MAMRLQEEGRAAPFLRNVDDTEFEIMTHLNPAEAFDQLILDLKKALGLTVVMITHDLDSLYAITDRIAVVADKRIVACAPAAELEHSDHPWIHDYFQGPRGRAARRAKEGDQ